MYWGSDCKCSKSRSNHQARMWADCKGNCWDGSLDCYSINRGWANPSRLDFRDKRWETYVFFEGFPSFFENGFARLIGSESDFLHFLFLAIEENEDGREEEDSSQEHLLWKREWTLLKWWKSCLRKMTTLRLSSNLLFLRDIPKKYLPIISNDRYLHS